MIFLHFQYLYGKYPDMLELYGDYGNIQVLKYRMEKRNIKCIIDKYSIGDEKPNFCIVLSLLLKCFARCQLLLLQK